MKVSKISILAMACLAIAIASTGCKHRPKDITVIKGQPVTPPADVNPTTTSTQTGDNTRTTLQVPPTNPIGDAGSTKTEPITPNPDGGFNTAGWEDLGDYLANREMFAQNTVYFEFDRHEVKSGERRKIDEVAVYLKGDTKVKILVEGHCDERGTEEYNRSLGERRALSVREYLINSGIAQDRIHTISFGEDKPAVPGQNDAAWSKNRRGVFVLLKPKA